MNKANTAIDTGLISRHPGNSPWACIVTTSPTGDLQANPVFLPEQDWYPDVCNRMFTLSKKQNGWKGPGSRATLRPTFEHAGHLLWKLVLDGIKRRPVIGLDYEGTFSFCWIDDHSSIDLTVYQDGTYSYFATDGKQSMTSDNALVAERISTRLLDLL